MKRKADDPAPGEKPAKKVKTESEYEEEAHAALKDVKRYKLAKVLSNFEKGQLVRGPSDLKKMNKETYDPMLAKVVKHHKILETNSEMVEVSAEELAKGAALAPVISADNPDQEFRIMFMSIGSGDCILIQTPAGKTVVIDCGTRCRPGNNDSFRKKIKDQLDLFLGTKKEISLLIFTHPDQDHYNETKTIVLKAAKTVKAIFHSMALNDYGENEVRAEFNKGTDRVVGRVKINGDGVVMETNLKGNKWDTLYPVPAKESRIKLLEEKHCTISLLAAEVPADYGLSHKAGSDVNAASMTTFIEVYGRKILLTGDATYGTENFLLKKHRDRVTNLDLMQMEHHGSGTEHAAADFVHTVNPYIAVASSGRHDSDLNPRWSTVKRYIDYEDTGFHEEVTGTKQPHRLRKNVDDHGVRYGYGISFIDPKAVTNFWNKDKKYRKYGLYTTDSDMEHIYFVVDKHENLIRKWDQTDGSHSVTIAKNGTVTVT